MQSIAKRSRSFFFAELGDESTRDQAHTSDFASCPPCGPSYFRRRKYTKVREPSPREVERDSQNKRRAHRPTSSTSARGRLRDGLLRSSALTNVTWREICVTQLILESLERFHLPRHLREKFFARFVSNVIAC